MYKHIKEDEVLTLFEAAMDENDGDFAATAHDMKTIDLLLGVQKVKSLIDRRSRKKDTRWSRGRNYQNVIEEILLR